MAAGLRVSGNMKRLSSMVEALRSKASGSPEGRYGPDARVYRPGYSNHPGSLVLLVAGPLALLGLGVQFCH